MPNVIQTAEDRSYDLRILMNTDNVGGVWSYTRTLLRALGEAEDEDVQVILAINGAPLRPDQRQALAALPHVTAFHGGFALEWIENPWDSVDQCGDWLQRLASLYQPDLVHLNDYSHAARNFGAPVLVVSHSDVFSWFHAVKLKAPDHRDAAPYHRYVTAGLRAADAVTAPAECVLDDLEAHYDDFARVPAIANAIPDLPDEAELAVDAEKDPQLILAAARLWDEGKNMAVLDTACARGAPPIQAAGPTQQPGDGSRPFPHLQLLGELTSEELLALRARTAIHVAPSLYEPFGLSNLEAARQKCALVLGDVPSQREIWGNAAALLDPRDPGAFREMLHYLIRYPEIRQDMGQRAYYRSLQFTPERQATAYLRLYHDLLGRPAPENQSLSPNTLTPATAAT